MQNACSYALFQAALRSYVHISAYQVLEIHQESPHIEETAARLHVDQEVHIALFVCISPRYGTEDAHVPRAVLSSYPENLFTLGSQQFVDTHDPPPSSRKFSGFPSRTLGRGWTGRIHDGRRKA